MSTLIAPRTIDVSTFRRPDGKPANKRLSEMIEIPEGLTLLERGAARPADGRVFRIMTPDAGDERLVWDSKILKEIIAAKKFFQKMVAKGFKPFRCDAKGKALPQVMKRFEADAEEIVFLPEMAVAGG